MKPGLLQSELQSKLSVIEPLLNAIAVFIMATIFLFWDASRAVYVLLSLAALVFIVKYRPRMPRDHRFYSWPIIGYVGATFLSLAFDGFTDSGTNRFTSRFALLLIAIPLVSVFYFSFNLKRNAWIKYAVGCIVMGALALVDILLSDKLRAGGGHNEVAFGFVALAMTSLVIASYYRFSETGFGRVVFYLAILMGVCAMILSGTRTSWLVVFALLPIAIFFYLDRYSFFKRVLFTLTLIFGIAIVSSSLPIVQKRVDEMIAMVTPYVKGEEQTKFNSLRYRVEAWKAAWNMGMADNVFGVGPGNWKKSLRAYVEQRPHLYPLGGINHAHNQFMHTFFTSGFVGLFSLIALFTCHFWIFAKYLRKRYSLEVRCFALAGLLLLVSYLLGSIPGVPFLGKQYLMMYGFASATIWGSLLGALRESESSEARASANVNN